MAPRISLVCLSPKHLFYRRDRSQRGRPQPVPIWNWIEEYQNDGSQNARNAAGKFLFFNYLVNLYDYKKYIA